MKYHSHSTTKSHYIACPDCDLLMPNIRPPKGQKTACPRCGRVLLQHCQDTVGRSFALALTGLLLYLPAVFTPLLTFRQLGLSERGNVLQTIMGFIDRDYYLVAASVFFAVVVFPLLKLSLLATVAFCLRIGKTPAFIGKAFRLYNYLGEWAMVEVYLLGIMITVVKMNRLVAIDFNIGFFCFIGLVLITMSISLTVCRESFWSLIDNEVDAIPPFQKGLSSDSSIAAFANHTAAANNLLVCSDCGKLSTALPGETAGRQHCGRCGAALHFRKPGSISRTWALIISATALLIPANLLPIMRVQYFGIPKNSTILDGIISFFQGGSYLIGLIILTASILIPIFKIVGLGIVLLTIRFKRHKYLRQKTTMFRFIEFIGRWSMLDIFVIALLGFFVNFGFLSSIETAPAATYFCLVVIATMLAALTFDPRIMWDMVLYEKQQEKSGL